MIVCIAGKNDIAVNCTDWILSEGFVNKENLRVCFNETDNGEDTFQKSFKKYSKDKSLIECKVEDLYEIEDLVFFSLEFDKIIKPKFFKSQSLFNIHFSLLPKYRGMYTSAWPILNGEKTSGVTLHRIDEGIDTGNIIDQIEFHIEENDTARDLYFNYLKLGESLFKNAYENIISKIFDEYVQPEGGSYYSKNSIDYKNIKIDFHNSAEEIRNQIRAFNFKEYQVPIVNGQPIFASEVLNVKSTKMPGEVVTIESSFMDIATLDYGLRLYLSDE